MPPSKPASKAAASAAGPAPAAAPPTTTATGKRTYADAMQSSASSTPRSVPPALGRDARRRRRRRLSGATAAAASPQLSRRLLSRELGLLPSAPATPPHASFAKQRFANIRLQATLDTHDDDAAEDRLLWLRDRSKVIEIVSSHDLIFSLTYNGVCAAFSRDLNRRICFLNVTNDEVIRSLFLNKTNDSLITVSVYKKDDFSSLHCRSTPLAHIRKGIVNSGHAVAWPDSKMPFRMCTSIFETESLRYPGFVEFDDVNGKILTFSAEDKTYKIWDLRTYRLLYTLMDERIQEVKISPGILLLIFKRHDAYVPIRILDIESGKKVKELNHLVHRKRKVNFIEQFHKKLLVKQENENLQIVDVCTGDVVEVERSNFLTPNAFIFLYESEHFLTFQQRQVNVWNFSGERVTNFEDHVLFRSDSHASSIYITQQQDIIVSYCQQDGRCRHGSINLSSICSGKLLGKVTCGSAARNLTEQFEGADPEHDEAHIRALDDVTALYYSEERNEIYSGSRDGLVHVWSN